jgi:DNA-binding LacI/PurR family transcriptional regulator
MWNGQTTEKRRFRKPSMRDVSKLANVSLTTVSDYLAGRPNVCNSETGKRIDAAAAELHYAQNSLVQGLRFGKNNCIGACVINRSEFQAGNNKFAGRLWEGIETAANEHHLLLLQYPLSVRNGSDVRPFLDGRIDGLLMSTEADDPRGRALTLAGMPCVFIDNAVDVPGNYGVVFRTFGRRVIAASPI